MVVSSSERFKTQSSKSFSEPIVCSNNLHSLTVANGVYANTFDDWSVPCQDSANAGHSVWTANTAFRTYIGYEGSEDSADQSDVQTPKKFRCPSDRQRPDEHAYNIETGNTGGTLVSYGYNIEDWYPSRGSGSWTGTPIFILIPRNRMWIQV